MSRNSEISYFDIAFAVKENVVKFDVAMGNIFRVDKVKTVYYLFENFLSERLFEATSLANIVKKVSSRTKLHHNHNMLLGFNCFVYFDNMIMSELQQQIDFFHEFCLLRFICEHFFVQ